MMKKRLFLAIMVMAGLLSMPPVFGAENRDSEAGRTGLRPILVTDSPAVQKGDREKLEKQLKDLLQELDRLQKEAEQKFRKDVLPQIQKEIDRLKEWLREFHLDHENEPETRQT